MMMIILRPWLMILRSILLSRIIGYTEYRGLLRVSMHMKAHGNVLSTCTVTLEIHHIS